MENTKKIEDFNVAIHRTQNVNTAEVELTI